MTEHVAPQGEIIKKRVEQFIVVRDRLKAMDEEHKKNRAPLLEIQEELSGVLQKYMDDGGATSIATENGTCYRTTRYTASLADAAAFMEFVKANNLFDLVDSKANANACKDYATEKGALPPGVNLTAISTVGVRRA